MTLGVLCVLRKGMGFGPEHVVALRSAVLRHSTVPHEFMCLNDEFDQEAGSPQDITWRATTEPSLLEHWGKAEMFKPGVVPFDECLYIDLSAVLVGNIDAFLTHPGCAVTADFIHGTPSQSVLKYEPARLGYIWHAFDKDREYFFAMGRKDKGGGRLPYPYDYKDQALMNHIGLPPRGYHFWQSVLPGQLESYKKHVAPRGGITTRTRIVKFHGKPKPWELDSEPPWMRGYFDARPSPN